MKAELLKGEIVQQPGGQQRLAGEGRDAAQPGLMTPCCTATSQGDVRIRPH